MSLPDRFYFSKLWYNERKAFKKGLKEWFVNTLSSKERRLIIREFYKKGLDSGLFECEVNQILYKLFGISLFCADNYWKHVQILEMPTWLLKRIVKIYSELERPACWKIADQLHKEFGIYPSCSLIWNLLFKTDTDRVIKAKEHHDKLLEKALKSVGKIEQDFILAVEENPNDLSSVYKEFAKRFESLQIQDLYFYVSSAEFYTALIDSALIDQVVERIGLKPPELWRWHISEVVK